MQVAIELPEDIAEDLRAKFKWKDLPRHALEAVPLEGYRSGALTESQVRSVLGFETRLQVNSFLRDRGVYYNYSPAELDKEIETTSACSKQGSAKSGRDDRHR